MGGQDIREALIADSSTWNSSLLYCCDDCGVCWNVLTAPVRSLNRLHFRAFGDCGAYPGCFLEYVDRNVRLVIDEMMSGTVRNRLRFIFGIKTVESGCTACCCLLCTLCQEEREVKIRDAELPRLPDEAPSSPVSFER